MQVSVSAALQDDGTSVYRVLLYCFAALLLVVLWIGTSGLLGLGSLLETLSGELASLLQRACGVDCSTDAGTD